MSPVRPIDEADGLAVQPRLRECGCFQPEMFHGLGGVDRFGRAHSGEPDGAILALIPDYESIAVNDALHTRPGGRAPRPADHDPCLGISQHRQSKMWTPTETNTPLAVYL